MKKYSVVILLLIVNLFTFNNPVLSQGLSSQQIDSLVDASFKAMPDQAGIAIAVIKDGKIIHSKGYGVTSIETKSKVDENTLFAIASNSKAFTAATLAILVDEGKLAWSDKVIDYIPEFKMYNPYVTADFTIIDLLTHRSGLGLGAGDLLIFPGSPDITISDILNSFQHQKQVSSFRTKFDYDNLLYIVAGEVVKRVSGMEWTEFVESRIMKPLGMNRSAAAYARIPDRKNIATPHSSETGTLKTISADDNYELIAPAGGIYTSVKDLSSWVLMQLNKGKYGFELKNQIFSETRQNEMWYPYTNLNFRVYPDKNSGNHFQGYGLGWFISDMKGYIVLHHTGGLAGMLSQVTLIPELNAGVIVLTNSLPGGMSYSTLSGSIVDALTGNKTRDRIGEMKIRLEKIQSNADSVLTAVWNTSKNPNEAGIDVNNFTGIYEDPWFGKVEIFRNGEDLYMKSLRSPLLTGKMLFYKATTFAVKWDYSDMNCDAFATFNLNPEGKAIEIKMAGISPNIDFSFDFQDLHLKRVE